VPEDILIVDDNQWNLELVSNLLEANGFNVYTAETAERGIELARERLPSLILMDFELPGMNGAKAARILKADPATQHLKIIGLTIEAGAGTKIFDGLLEKPIDTRTFVASIRAFIAAPKKTP